MKTFSYLTCVVVLFMSFSSYAEPASGHSGKASKHSAFALSHGIAGSAQVAGAVVAVPLVVVGSVAVSAGTASVELGEDMSKVAASKARHVQTVQPVALDITEITITVDRSPAQAMKADQ